MVREILEKESGSLEQEFELEKTTDMLDKVSDILEKENNIIERQII